MSNYRNSKDLDKIKATDETLIPIKDSLLTIPYQDTLNLAKDTSQVSRESSGSTPKSKGTKMVQSALSTLCSNTNDDYLEQLAVMRSRVSSLDISERGRKSDVNLSKSNPKTSVHSFTARNSSTGVIRAKSRRTSIDVHHVESKKSLNASLKCAKSNFNLGLDSIPAEITLNNGEDDKIIFVKPVETNENASSIGSTDDEISPNSEITPRMFEVPPKKVCVRLKTPNINPSVESIFKSQLCSVQKPILEKFVETVKTVNPSEDKSTNTEGVWARVPSPSSADTKNAVDPRVIIHKSSNNTSVTSVEDDWVDYGSVSHVTSIESPELQISPCSESPRGEAVRIKKLLDDTQRKNNTEKFAYCTCNGKEYVRNLFDSPESMHNQQDLLSKEILEKEKFVDSLFENPESSDKNTSFIQNLFCKTKYATKAENTTQNNDSLDKIEVLDDSISTEVLFGTDSHDKIETQPAEIICEHAALYQKHEQMLFESPTKKKFKKNKVVPFNFNTETITEENFTTPLKNLGENTNILIKDVVSNLALHFFKCKEDFCTRDEVVLEEEENNTFKSLVHDVGNLPSGTCNNEAKAELLRKILSDNIEYFKKNGVQMNRRPQITNFGYYHIVRSSEDPEIGAGENVLKTDSVQDLDAIERMDRGDRGDEVEEEEENVGCCTLKAWSQCLFTKKPRRFY